MDEHRFGRSAGLPEVALKGALSGHTAQCVVIESGGPAGSTTNSAPAIGQPGRVKPRMPDRDLEGSGVPEQNPRGGQRTN